MFRSNFLPPYSGQEISLLDEQNIVTMKLCFTLVAINERHNFAFSPQMWFLTIKHLVDKVTKIS